MSEIIKWRCPMCGSFMGITHRPGERVFCSWGEGDKADPQCAEHGWAEHPAPGDTMPRNQTELGDENGRTWTRYI